MKTQEVPVPLRAFYEQFRKLEYRHDYVTVFDDFLTAMLNFFTPPEFPPHDVTCFNKYKEDERKIFGPLIVAAIKIYDSQIVNDTDWYDPFGDFYQLLASRGKQSALGQFFTPITVVDFMTKIQGNAEELTGKGLRINDPACGSGRFLIAYHANFPGNCIYGEDIDLMCCKMACINLMVHGCEGQVVNKNALDPCDFRNAWQINGSIRATGIPSIAPIEKEKCFSYLMGQNQLQENEQARHDAKQKVQELKMKTVGFQMGMFN